jgi:hypothetical protein
MPLKQTVTLTAGRTPAASAATLDHSRPKKRFGIQTGGAQVLGGNDRPSRLSQLGQDERPGRRRCAFIDTPFLQIPANNSVPRGVSEVGAARIEQADGPKARPTSTLCKLELQPDSINQIPVESHAVLEEGTPDIRKGLVRLKLHRDAQNIFMGALRRYLGDTNTEDAIGGMSCNSLPDIGTARSGGCRALAGPRGHREVPRA